MYIEITLAYGCKNNCVYCPQQKLMRNVHKLQIPLRTRMMSFELFKNIIDKLPPKMDVAIGGMSEPFQNKDCVDMILYASEKGHDIYLCTTLAGVTLEMIQNIINKVFRINKRNKIIVHLPADKKEKLENIPVEKDFEVVLKELLRTKVNAEYHHHGKMVHPVAAKILQSFAIDPLLITPKSRAGNLELDGVPLIKRKQGKLFCLRHNLHGHVVLPDGTVVLCCMDYGMKHILGNITHSSYRSIHESGMNKLVSLGLKDESLDILCRNCHAAQYADRESVFKNMELGIPKIKLGIKLGVYHTSRPLYSALRSIKKSLVRRTIK